MAESIVKRVISAGVGIGMILLFSAALYCSIYFVAGPDAAKEIYLYTIGVFAFIMLVGFLFVYLAVKECDNWILCSDEMPTENGQYLCIASNGKQYVCDYGYSHEKEKMAFFHVRAVMDIVAWQYLLEPPIQLQKS